ncbi:hypothetical protein NDU88_001870 [Pleurodeles waltl]|uniref:Uncharacterized protein n=1 Tax=Pleurodeles waltl TaxID=8319 RepID=A0AAV7RCG1_PLEWA|nr:hypothetical protein NDU88_001870 [Pleurodeles waltl]
MKGLLVALGRDERFLSPTSLVLVSRKRLKQDLLSLFLPCRMSAMKGKRSVEEFLPLVTTHGKVQEEIDRVLGSEHSNTGHRKRMPYTDAIIHEVQRFGNIVPLGVPRETTVDVNFKGYFIPKGTHIIPLLESVLYDRTQFAKPEEFNPQHFLDSDGRFLKNDALMSFGAGRRMCIVKTLATTELFVFFTSLLQKFILRLPPGVTHIDLTPAIGFTTPPLPFELCALPRS